MRLSIVWTRRFPCWARPLGYWRLIRARVRFDDYFSWSWKRPFFLEKKLGYSSRLKRWQDSEKGKPGFVLGNGPSLAKMDLTCLKDQVTIGSNGVYRQFDQWGFSTRFLLFEDIEQTEIRRKEIARQQEPVKLAGLHNAYAIPADRRTLFFRARLLDASFCETQFPQFSEDFSFGVHLGSTITYIGIQLAFFLGCDPIYLIGVDHHYGDLEIWFPPAKIPVTAMTKPLLEQAHFSPNYYRLGDEMGVPLHGLAEAAYMKAREHIESRGRRIFNAGLDSHLDVFEKRPFTGIFGPSTPLDSEKAGGSCPTVASQSTPQCPSKLGQYLLLFSRSLGSRVWHWRWEGELRQMKGFDSLRQYLLCLYDLSALSGVPSALLQKCQVLMVRAGALPLGQLFIHTWILRLRILDLRYCQIELPDESIGMESPCWETVLIGEDQRGRGFSQWLSRVAPRCRLVVGHPRGAFLF